MSQNVSLFDWCKLVFLSILWGLSFIFMEVALTELQIFTIVLGRVAIAACALNLFVALQGRHLWQYREHWLSFAIMGLFGNAIPFALIVWGQVYITASLSSILNATLPFFTLIVAHVFTADERMTRLRVVALAIGFLGVMVIIGPGAMAQDVSFDFIVGELSVLLAVVFYAIVIVYAKRFRRLGVPSQVAATGQASFATLFIIPLALMLEQPWTIESLSLPVIGAVLGSGLLSTALAFLLWYHLLARIGSNNTSLVTFLIPVSAILIAGLFLGEMLEGYQMAGMALIAAGLFLIDGRIVSRFAIKPV